MAIGVRARFLVAASLIAAASACTGILPLDDGEELRFDVIDAASTTPSARASALQLLKRLAEGNVEEAAALSNAPGRRYEVLRDYRARVGEEEFKRVFSRYFEPQNRLVAEVALGPRRLLIWQLGEAAEQLAGQYYVAVDGKFLMDDVPSAERAQLRRVLQAYRSGKLRF